MKEYCISNIGIERFKQAHFAWIYIHTLPPLKDDLDAALNFAVLLRSKPECVHAESTGDEIDIEYTLTDGNFRFAYDGIHGMVIECDFRQLERVKDYLIPFCTVQMPNFRGGRSHE